MIKISLFFILFINFLLTSSLFAMQGNAFKAESSKRQGEDKIENNFFDFDRLPDGPKARIFEMVFDFKNRASKPSSDEIVAYSCINRTCRGLVRTELQKAIESDGRGVVVRTSGISDKAFKSFFSNQGLLNVKKLKISFECSSSLPLLFTLPESIESLDLSDNEIDSIKGCYLTFLLKLNRLKHLNLSNNRLSPNKIAPYLRPFTAMMVYLEDFTALTHLNLNNNYAEDSGVAFLKRFTNLTYLDLGGHNWTDDGQTEGLECLTALTYLDISRIDNLWRNHDAVFPRLAVGLRRLTNLTHLNMADNHITTGGLSYLTDLTNLTHLDIRHNQITAAGLSYLTDLKNLTHLDLWGNTICEEGLRYLPEFSALTHLDINYNSIQEFGPDLLYLAELTALTYLDCGENRIYKDTLRILRQKLPNTKIDCSIDCFDDFSDVSDEY